MSRKSTTTIRIDRPRKNFDNSNSAINCNSVWEFLGAKTEEGLLLIVVSDSQNSKLKELQSMNLEHPIDRRVICIDCKSSKFKLWTFENLKQQPEHQVGTVLSSLPKESKEFHWTKRLKRALFGKAIKTCNSQAHTLALKSGHQPDNQSKAEFITIEQKSFDALLFFDQGFWSRDFWFKSAIQDYCTKFTGFQK